MKPRNRKEGNLVLNVHRDETFDPRGKMKPRWYGPFIIKKIMLGSATRITNLDGEEMLRQSTWKGFGSTIFKKEKKREEERKACKVENPKGRPRKKLRQRNPTRLKTRKDDLGKR